MADRTWARHLAALAGIALLLLAWQYLAVQVADRVYGQPNDGWPATAWRHWRAYGWDDRSYRLVQSVGGFLCAILAVQALCALYGQRVALHGNARFATLAELRKAGLLAPQGILLARHNDRYLVFDGQEFVLLAAPTRSGKGVSLVIPNLLNWRDSVVVLDVKLENWQMTSGWRQKVLGQEVHLFNPFDTEGRTSRWNPLDFISRDPRQMPADALQVAQVLYPSSPGDKNRFFYDTAQNLFMGLVMFLIETGHPCVTLAEVFRQASGCGRPLGEHLDEQLQAHPGLSTACRDALARFLGISGETQANVKATFDAALLVFASPTVDRATSASDFDLREIRRRRQSIYFGLPVDRLELASRVINLFFTQAIHLNTRVLPEDDPSLCHQALLCLDEFPAFGRLQAVLRGVAFIAGYNLRLLTIVQSLSQLKAPEMYGPQGAETLVANHAVRVIFPPTTDTEAREYSEMLGTYTLRETSQSHSTHTGHLLSLQSGGNSGTSTSSQRRALLMPQELKQLPRHTALVDRQGMPPARCTKAYYYDDPVFLQRLAQVSPGLATLLREGRRPTQDEITRLRVAGEFSAAMAPAAPEPPAPTSPGPSSATGMTAAQEPADSLDGLARRLHASLPDWRSADDLNQWMDDVRAVLATELPSMRIPAPPAPQGTSR